MPHGVGRPSPVRTRGFPPTVRRGIRARHVWRASGLWARGPHGQLPRRGATPEPLSHGRSLQLGVPVLCEGLRHELTGGTRTVGSRCPSHCLACADPEAPCHPLGRVARAQRHDGGHHRHTSCGYQTAVVSRRSREEQQADARAGELVTAEGGLEVALNRAAGAQREALGKPGAPIQDARLAGARARVWEPQPAALRREVRKHHVDAPTLQQRQWTNRPITKESNLLKCSVALAENANKADAAQPPLRMRLRNNDRPWKAPQAAHQAVARAAMVLGRRSSPGFLRSSEASAARAAVIRSWRERPYRKGLEVVRAALRAAQHCRHQAHVEEAIPLGQPTSAGLLVRRRPTRPPHMLQGAGDDTSVGPASALRLADILIRTVAGKEHIHNPFRRATVWPREMHVCIQHFPPRRAIGANTLQPSGLQHARCSRSSVSRCEARLQVAQAQRNEGRRKQHHLAACQAASAHDALEDCSKNAAAELRTLLPERSEDESRCTLLRPLASFGHVLADALHNEFNVRPFLNEASRPRRGRRTSASARAGGLPTRSCLADRRSCIAPVGRRHAVVYQKFGGLGPAVCSDASCSARRSAFDHATANHAGSGASFATISARGSRRSLHSYTAKCGFAHHASRGTPLRPSTPATDERKRRATPLHGMRAR